MDTRNIIDLLHALDKVYTEGLIELAATYGEPGMLTIMNEHRIEGDFAVALALERCGYSLLDVGYITNTLSELRGNLRGGAQ